MGIAIFMYIITGIICVGIVALIFISITKFLTKNKKSKQQEISALLKKEEKRQAINLPKKEIQPEPIQESCVEKDIALLQEEIQVSEEAIETIDLYKEVVEEEQMIVAKSYELPQKGVESVQNNEILIGQKRTIGKMILTSEDKSIEPIIAHYNGDSCIGRNRMKNSIVIEGDPTISGTHCRIYRSGSNDYISDLNSKNGTGLNGKRIEGSIKLQNGDKVHIGQRVYIIKIEV